MLRDKAGHGPGEKAVLHSDQRLHALANSKGANQARSFDLRDSLAGAAERPAVSKSFSFGGYPAPQHLEPRLGPPASPQYRPAPPGLVKGQVVWAVSDVSTVPPGSLLINPDNGTPYLNGDGSVYLFDPANPPRLEAAEPAAELAKLTLEPGPSYPEQATQLYCGPTGPRPQQLPAPPYILVNPGPAPAPLPQYLPYLSHAPAPPPPPPRALLFSLHRAPPRALSLLLQHCPSLLTRAQLTSFLDSLLGPAAPGLHGGTWQFLDRAGVWCDLAGLPPDTPTTNRFPTQLFWESEERAGVTVAALRSLGFLAVEQSGQE